MSDDSPYSNRELDARHKSIDDKLDLILAQTTKTNGRVSSLETEKVKAEQTIRILKWVSATIIIPVAFLLVDKFI